LRRAALLAALTIALAAAPVAGAATGRIAVGLAPGASPETVIAAVEALTGGTVDRSLLVLDAFVVQVADRDAALAALEGAHGVEYVELVSRSRSILFEPTDPLAFFQWYLDSIRAFDFWETPPPPPTGNPVLVAVIDSGIDIDHPEFAGRVANTKSFVGSRATVDSIGHGTMIAGEIAGALDNAQGIAGVAFSAELLIAKIIQPDGTASLEDEAAAIRWAVDQGASVINLSLGGQRDPTNPANDEYSELEQSAVEYAYRNGAVVVAATGNCIAVCPYRYASYPAALPHVLGVSALGQNGETPTFSNRDPVYNDLAAPGSGIVSTFPLALTDPSCAHPGYSICAQSSLRNGNGTSFAAPLAAAAAAVLRTERPQLTASQVMEILEESAADIATPGRDSLTGNGLLDLQAALEALSRQLPPPDRYETNDDAGSRAFTLYGAKRTISATIDPYDDQNDVYRVYVRSGQRLVLTLRGPNGGRPTLAVWRPGTKTLTRISVIAIREGRVLAHKTASNPRLTYRATRTGWHYVHVKAPAKRGGPYKLVVAKR
jgi:subtilisin family serine protease